MQTPPYGHLEPVVTIRPLHGDAIAIALFNRGDEPKNIEFKWSEMGVKHLGKVRDVWEHSDVPLTSVDTYSATVPPHGVVLLRVSDK